MVSWKSPKLPDDLTLCMAIYWGFSLTTMFDYRRVHYTHIHMHACIHPYIHPCVHMYIHTYVRTYIPFHCIGLHCIALHCITLPYSSVILEFPGDLPWNSSVRFMRSGSTFSAARILRWSAPVRGLGPAHQMAIEMELGGYQFFSDKPRQINRDLVVAYTWCHF